MSANDVKFLQSIMGQGRVNQLGGTYINGRPLPLEIRHEIVRRSQLGIKPCDISRELKISHGAVSKILNRFAATGSITPGQIGGNPRQRVSIQSVEKHIATLKESRPELGPAEIRQDLIDHGVCTKTNAPTVASITRHLKARGLKMKHVVGSSEVVHSSPAAPPPNRSPPSTDTPSNSGPKFSIANLLSANAEAEQSPNGGQPSTDERSATSTPTGRQRTNFAPSQVEKLERAYEANPYPDQQAKEELAKSTQLDENKIQVWFSNRRARQRKILSSNPVLTAEHLLRSAAAQHAAQPAAFFQQSPPLAAAFPPPLFPPQLGVPPLFCLPPNYLIQLGLLNAQMPQKLLP